MTQKRVLWIFIVLAAVYLSFNVLLEPEETALNRYQLTADELKLLRLSIALPIVMIWFIGYYGFTRTKAYAQSIANTKEGPAFNKIAQGLLALALWLPVLVISGNATTYIESNHSEFTVAANVIKNYIDVSIILLALYLLYQGSRQLVQKAKRVSLPNYSFVNGLFFILGLFFVYWTLINPVRQFPSADTPTAVYYMPDWLLVPTIILPYLAAFYFGLQAFQNILHYRLKIKGVLYRNALSYLANGIGILLLSLIALRYMSAFTTYLEDTGLKIILLIVYILVLFMAIGYILIANGAKKLQRIEEV